MPNLINRLIVRELSQDFEGAEGMVVVALDGLSVEETEGLRNGLAERGVRMRMVRNRLARIALAERGVEAPADLLVGNVGLVCGGIEDAIHAAKVLHQSDARKSGKVTLRGGLLEGNLLGASEAQALAELPGRDELRARLLRVISGPAQGLVGLLHAPQSALARVIQAHAEAASGPGSDTDEPA